jgi:hypothetical protein
MKDEKGRDDEGKDRKGRDVDEHPSLPALRGKPDRHATSATGSDLPGSIKLTLRQPRR